MKTCAKCGIEKSLTEFNKKHDCKLGVAAQCRDCVKKRNAVIQSCSTCSKEFFARQVNIDKGLGRYCSHSCRAKKTFSTHSHTADKTTSSTYHTWANMRSRCLNPNNPKYSYYGGAGIGICDRWSSFANFLEDMGHRPEDRTIDRINGSLGYFKENCRWATKKEQQNNLVNNTRLTHKGETKTISEWADENGIKKGTLRHRIKNNWSEDSIFGAPEKGRSAKLRGAVP